MVRFARAFLILASVYSCSAVPAAKEIPGTPEALIGSFGTSIKQCEEHQEEYAFTTPYYRTCPNPGCMRRILSHQITPRGYRLKIQDDGNFKTWSERITVIDKNTIKWTVTKATTLHRCSGLKTERRTVDLIRFSRDFLDAAYRATKRPPPAKYLHRLHPETKMEETRASLWPEWNSMMEKMRIHYEGPSPDPVIPFFWFETLAGFPDINLPPDVADQFLWLRVRAELWATFSN